MSSQPGGRFPFDHEIPAGAGIPCLGGQSNAVGGHFADDPEVVKRGEGSPSLARAMYLTMATIKAIGMTQLKIVSARWVSIAPATT
jgi:hypothetical protein